MLFFMCLQQEIHSFSTMKNGSRPRGRIATAIETPWSDGARKPIKIDVSKISCQPQARLVNPTHTSPPYPPRSWHILPPPPGAVAGGEV